MKPIRSYKQATIFDRQGGMTDAFKVDLFTGYVVFFDKDGNERTWPMYYVAEIVNYQENDQPETEAPQESCPEDQPKIL